MIAHRFFSLCLFNVNYLKILSSIITIFIYLYKKLAAPHGFTRLRAAFVRQKSTRRKWLQFFNIY